MPRSRGRPVYTVGRGPVPRHATIARDRPSRYGWTEGSRGTGPRATVNEAALYTVGRGPVPRHAAIARDRPARYGAPVRQRSRGTGPRATVNEDARFYRRAGACPPPCCGLPKTREGQALALRLDRGIARDRPSRYGFSVWLRSRGTGPRPTGLQRYLRAP